MKSTFLHGHVIAIIAAGLLFTTLFAPYAAGHEIIGWGNNDYGQATPPAGNDFIAVAAGFWHGLALKSDGSIVGWGNDSNGQATPPAGNDFIAIAAGHLHSLALKSDGSIVCWGDNSFGQATPPAGNDFIAIAASGRHSLALKSDGTIVGWGNNDCGQATPPAGNNFIAVAAGQSHSLALKSDGSIVGWGWNTSGQATPPAGNDFMAVAAGGLHSLALKSDGSIVGWGWNNCGQATPPAGNDFTAVAAGGQHNLAIKSDGSIVGWGLNNFGQATPPTGNDFIAVAAGQSHSLALRETVYDDPNMSPSTILITRCTVTAGSKAGSNKISFSGLMDANADDISAASAIEVTVDSNDIVNPCVLTFPIDAKTFKKGKYSYSKTANGVRKSFTYNLKTGKFSFAASNIDLSGLACPLTVQIEINSYVGVAEVDETVVNGPKRPIPILLMMGVKNVLRVDKCQIKQNNKKSDSDQLSVSGAFAVEDTDVNMVNEEFVVTLDSQTFTLPAGSFKTGKGKFTCSKAPVTESNIPAGTASATFNFTTCSFILTIKNMTITAGSGAVDFCVAFAGYSQCVQVTLPTAPTGGTTLRILPGYTLSACIDTYTGESHVNPQTLMAAGGSPFAGYTWSKPALSTFPFGTTVAPLTGVFSSTGGALNAAKPEQTFTVEVSDGTSTKTGSVTLNVTTASSAPSDGIPMPGCPEMILQQSIGGSFALDDAVANKPYGASLFVMGGTPPYSWREDTSYSGRGDFDLSGLTIDWSRGIVRGTPFNSASGKTLKFRVIVRDSAGNTDVESRYGMAPVYTITVR